MYGSMEESPPAAEAPALGPAELKAVRKLLSTTSSSIGGSDVTDQPGLLHEPQELSTSTLSKLEAASDEVELHGRDGDADLPCASEKNFRDRGQVCACRGILVSASSSDA